MYMYMFMYVQCVIMLHVEAGRALLLRASLTSLGPGDNRLADVYVQSFI